MCIPGITEGIFLAVSSQLSVVMDSHPASGSLGKAVVVIIEVAFAAFDTGKSHQHQ